MNNTIKGGVMSIIDDVVEEEADFNFMEESTDDETATSGNLGAVTNDIIREAKRLAVSPEGLDIAAFQRKYKIHVMNIDDILTAELIG